MFEALPPELPRVVSVGRLDLNTEGLLLLTTDGELARHLELPSTGWLRRYRVRAHGRVDASRRSTSSPRASPSTACITGRSRRKIDREQGSNVWLTLGLREGKNREVKRLAEALGLTVNRLIRVSFGPFALGDLPAAQVERGEAAGAGRPAGRQARRRIGIEQREPEAASGAAAMSVNSLSCAS